MIALICGTGSFPKEIFKILNKKKIKYIIINLTEKNLSKLEIKLKIGQFGKLFKTLKENNCKEVIFAGKITRPSLQNIKFDTEGLKILPELYKIFKKGDYKILNFIIKLLKKKKIKTISHTKYCKALTIYANLTSYKPTTTNIVDLKIAINLFNKFKKDDLGQSIIVDRCRIVGVEGAFGTDQIINNYKKFNKTRKKNTGILVKIPKKNQDFEIDLPTIGYKTIKNCISAGLAGIYLKKGKNVILDKNKCKKLADKKKFFISVF